MTEEAIFHEAMTRAPTDRAAYLDEACAGNPALRAAVEALLRADVGATGFLESPPVGSAATATMPASEGPGAVIGPYKIVELIGEGGMGAVYLAQQTEPVKRLVALKVIKSGMDSRQVLARFEAERQALALMDHPNIAKVLDAGTVGQYEPEALATDRARSRPVAYASGSSGRPYFVMELVKGVPITRFCDERKLTPRERLELFLPVCHAIQHAHQKGIIHRDIKPSNVLVALYDGKPVPKVIDFGVAKAAGQPLTEKTVVTGLGALVGTPEYMSPEQAELNQLDIDTRSDIYTLGVLLYELLTGTTPLTRKRLKDAALLEVLRVIREEEPQKPSTRLSTTDELPTIAANRGTEPARLSRLVRGELDWIIMKALEKDRNRRYETANGFAADVQRYLAGEAVVAVPPSATYRLRKFVRRNRGPVLAVALIFMALMSGVVGTTWGMIDAERARQRAVDSERETFEATKAERAATAAAVERLEQVKKSHDVLARLFMSLSPVVETDGRFIRTILGAELDRAAAELDAGAIGDRLAVAHLHHDIGIAQLGLGFAEKAIQLFQRAIQIRTAELGDAHQDTLETKTFLVTAFHGAGRLKEAEGLAEETRKLCDTQLGPTHRVTLLSMTSQARVFTTIGRQEEAVAILEDQLKIRKAAPGSRASETAMTLQSLGDAYRKVGRLNESLETLRQGLAIMQAQYGSTHHFTSELRRSFVVSLLEAGRWSEAMPLSEENVRFSKLTPDHPALITDLSNLSGVYALAGQHKKALSLQEECLELKRTKLGPTHPTTLASMNNMTSAYLMVGRVDDALKNGTETLRLRKETLGPTHPDTLHSMGVLAQAYATAKRFDDAIRLGEETLKLRKQILGDLHGNTLLTMNNLAAAYRDACRYQRAEELARVLVDSFRKQKEPGSIGLDDALAMLAVILLRQSKFEAAEPHCRECFMIRMERSSSHWRTAHAESLLGRALSGRKKYEDAKQYLHRGYEGMKTQSSLIPAHNRAILSQALEWLVELHEKAGEPDEANKWRKELERNRIDSAKLDK